MNLMIVPGILVYISFQVSVCSTMYLIPRYLNSPTHSSGEVSSYNVFDSQIFEFTDPL